MTLRRSVLIASLGLGLGAWFLFRPVCVPISDDVVATAKESMPLEQRPDRYWFGRVFQKRDGGWYQCNTWIARAFFF